MSKLSELLTQYCPNGVQYKALGEIGSVKMCKRILKSQTDTSGEVPFFKIGTFGKTPDAYISQELFDEYKEKYSYPKKGDILISCSGTIGRTVTFDGEPAYFQDSNIVWLEHDGSQVLNKYLEYCYAQKPWKIIRKAKTFEEYQAGAKLLFNEHAFLTEPYYQILDD